MVTYYAFSILGTWFFGEKSWLYLKDEKTLESFAYPLGLPWHMLEWGLQSSYQLLLHPFPVTILA